jgi:membrane protease YdiL (CAAX protease family)
MGNKDEGGNNPGDAIRCDGVVLTAPAWWRTYVTDVIADTELAAERHRGEVPRGESLRRVVVVLVGAAISLTFINFFRGPATLAAIGGAGLTANVEFSNLVWWALVSIVCYVAIPVAAILVLRGSFSDYGAGRPVTRSSWRPYGLLFALSAPFVIAASYLPGFQVKYPFYHLSEGESIWPYLAIFWVLYALQFVALEFFFRGFLLFGLAPRLGISAVFVMVVPYAMIHFTKPLAEALSAILGGTVLGFLSLKTRSVWWGAALHIAIAMSMDLLALGHAGLL